MTVSAIAKTYMHKFFEVLRRNAKANGGKVQGPLARITDALGLSFLDDEWKRAMFFGFFVAVLGFFITLLGNLTQKDDDEEEEEKEEQDQVESEVIDVDEAQEKDNAQTEAGELAADDTHLQQQEAQGQNEGAKPVTEDPQKQVGQGNGPASLSENAWNVSFPSLRKLGSTKRKSTDVVENAVADSVQLSKKVSLGGKDPDEDAKQLTIAQTIASWSLFSMPAGTFDGSSEAFKNLIDKLRPKWWTDELANNMQVITNLYSRLVMGVMETHTFRYPVALNILLAGLVFWELEHEVKEVGLIGNNSLAKAHYYLQFADASYSQDLRSAGILRRSVIKASLGPRDAVDNCLRHVLFVDHLTKSVVLMIRGTADFNDMLVDLLATEVEFLGGVAHAGLLEEARSVLQEVGPLIEPTLRMFGYKNLVLTGHSLGAGTAVLVSLILRNEYPILDDVSIQCFVYGCPPVIGPPEKFPADDQRLSRVEITSFVYNADVIPRTSLFALELGFRLWIALDLIEDFGLSDRLRCLVTGKIPEEVSKKVLALVKESENKSNYQKMIVPGKIVWLVRNSSENDQVKPPDSTTTEEKSEFIVSCPSDPLSISTQPMFVGTTWLQDHRLSEYRKALETV